MFYNTKKWDCFGHYYLINLSDLSGDFILMNDKFIKIENHSKWSFRFNDGVRFKYIVHGVLPNYTIGIYQEV